MRAGIVQFAMGLAGVAALATVAGTSGSLGPTNLERIKGYRKWPLATSTPQDMTPAMMLSCIGPMPPNTPPNPHVPRVFLVYVNAIGKDAMLSRERKAFPDGTVIVKEKYERPKVDFRTDIHLSKEAMAKVLAQKPELLTVMFKEKGEWNYFVVGPDGKEQKGDLEYCRKCHATDHSWAKAVDSVFKPYVPGYIR